MLTPWRGSQREAAHALVMTDVGEHRLHRGDPLAVKPPSLHRVDGPAAALVDPVPGTYRVDNALDVVQIDHTPVDVIVVDEVYRLPIGRPWLTLAIDVATRVVVGFYVSLEAPSSTSLAICLPRPSYPRNPG